MSSDNMGEVLAARAKEKSARMRQEREQLAQLVELVGRLTTQVEALTARVAEVEQRPPVEIDWTPNIDKLTARVGELERAVRTYHPSYGQRNCQACGRRILANEQQGQRCPGCGRPWK